MIFWSSFVTCSGYMCFFGLRFCLGRFVVMPKPMVAAAEKVIAQRQSEGQYKVDATFWKMSFPKKC